MAAGNSLLDASFLQNFLELVDGNGTFPERIVSAVGALPKTITQPAIFRQLASVLDPKQRETYDPNPAIQWAKQYAANVPLLSRLLPAKTDAYGQVIERNKGTLDAFDAFLNPFNVSQEHITDVQHELIRLHNATDAGDALLDYPDKRFASSKATPGGLQLTAQEYVSYAQRRALLILEGGSGKDQYGRTVTLDGYAAIINSDAYLAMDDDEKVKLLSNYQRKANEVAKWEVLAARGIPYIQKGAG